MEIPNCKHCKKKPGIVRLFSGFSIACKNLVGDCSDNWVLCKNKKKAVEMWESQQGKSKNT